MRPTITAFERSPDGGQGLARDTRVRWALEEAGQPYGVRLVSFAAMKAPAHLALNPFGQIPTYEEGDLALFETGAIVLHIAQRHAVLLPDEANALLAGVPGATGGEHSDDRLRRSPLAHLNIIKIPLGLPEKAPHYPPRLPLAPPAVIHGDRPGRCGGLWARAPLEARAHLSVSGRPPG